MYPNLLKRILDVALAVVAIILLLPVFLLVAAGLAVANRGKVFFRQTRPGKGGRLFRIFKFKTMNDLTDEHGKLLPDELRLTPMGSFVRKTSLDEIPQIINVLKGDMSFVGPRPLLVEYLPLYNSTQLRRHEVRPGITGWAQVNGRNAISWEQKFTYDVWYVDHQSFALDLKILYKTLLKVMKREGISAQEHVTMPPFRGTAPEEQMHLAASSTS
ncbi:sugar transferase [Pontibacter russatus]|uniref:sugar transferase n=1 Tax=Pontibacter russatus TaxID=2694929 RepID=UPI00137A3F93|nr:sugar transferase [Pontibacter russatus]